jgi:DNA-binding MurR/RpiR family transcriptional regulator
MVLASLAPAEQRVGRIILSRPATAAHLTITDLAGMAETSQTTVIRFCRSIGIGSYSHLKIALATAAGRAGATAPPRLSPDVNPDDDMASMIAKIAAADIQAITDTVAHLAQRCSRWPWTPSTKPIALTYMGPPPAAQ